MSNKLVKIVEFGSRIEAEIIQSLLESNGISSFIKADDCGGLYASQSFSIGVAVYVDESEFTYALSLINNPLEFNDDTDFPGNKYNDSDSLEISENS
jgi:hypothetical protein